jgi:hypothetical protein
MLPDFPPDRNLELFRHSLNFEFMNYRTGAHIPTNRPSRWRPPTILLFAASLMILSGVAAVAQPKLQLKRTKHDTFPLTIQLYGGYNGMSDPSEKLQDMFENTVQTSWGGLMMGARARTLLDTLVRPIWLGVDFHYHRSANRWLDKIPNVMFVSDSSRVRAEERLNTYGAQVFFGIDVVAGILLELGGGLQYYTGKTDIESPVLGLFQPVWVPVVMTAVNAPLLKYEHGSIDANFRFVKGFGDYGSFHIQSLLVFTFNF